MSALNIKDRKVAEKARKLAKLKGQSITAAVSDALDASLRTATQKAAVDREIRERQVDDIVRRFRTHLKRGAPTPQQVEDELYDPSGLPR